MSDANKTQVGGDHYKTSVEHWDFTELNRMGYLEGCATKYVSRWRKKNGLQDLQKAIHYIDKLRELFNAGVRQNRAEIWTVNLTTRKTELLMVPPKTPTVEEFCQANGLGELERIVIQQLKDWSTDAHLLLAREAVWVLIQRAEQERIAQLDRAVPG